MYSEMLDDEKVQMLSPELFKTWVNLLCIACTRNGVLLSVEKLAFKLRVSTHEMQSRLEDLVIAGLVDIRSDKQYEPHNWQQRQWKSDDSKERVRKHREVKRQCNADVTVTVTSPESSESDTDKDSSGLTSVPSAAREPDKGKIGRVDSGFGGKEWNEEERLERIVHQAIRFDIPINELIARIPKGTKKNPVRSRASYLKDFCVQDLQKRFPSIHKTTLAAAMWGNGAASETVVKAVWGAMA